jgi:hypothetical protein
MPSRGAAPFQPTCEPIHRAGCRAAYFLEYGTTETRKYTAMQPYSGNTFRTMMDSNALSIWAVSILTLVTAVSAPAWL